jgi:ABC-2 type transport system ATP-binding protein
MSEFIEVVNLSKSFGRKTIFSNLSFATRNNKTLLLGENGIGKSTIFRMMYGLERPSYGSISIMKMDPQLETENMRRHVGYVPSEPAFPSYLLVNDLYDLVSSYASTNEIERLEMELSLHYIRHRTPKFLSSGEKQGLAFIMAMSTKKEAYLMDEPVSAMDRERRLRTLKIINEYPGKILISAHDIAEVMTLSADALRMYKDNSSQGALTQHIKTTDLNITISFLNYAPNTERIEDSGISFERKPPVVTIGNDLEDLQKLIGLVSNDFILAMRDMNV